MTSAEASGKAAPTESELEPDAGPGGLLAGGRRRIVLAVLGGIAALVVLYVAVPALAGLNDTWRRLESGDVDWLIAAGLLELASFASYIAFLRAVFAGPPGRIGWRESYRISMAGVAATRVLAIAGAGGIALTAWALRRAGFARREVAGQMAGFYVLLYGVYMATLLVCGLGLYSGALPGPSPRGLTLVPAIFGGTVIALFLITAAVVRDPEGILAGLDDGAGDAGVARTALATVPATMSSGVRNGIALVRRRKPGLLGAVGWWAFDIAVLWACLRAFGAQPPVAVVVMGYFVGMLANALPIPGGIGAVDGGMAAALIGFGVDGGVAIVGVLSYRAFAFWLPIVPGVIAYVQLLRTPPVSQAAAGPPAGDDRGAR